MKISTILAITSTSATAFVHNHAHYEAKFNAHVEAHSLTFEDDESFVAALRAFKDNSDFIETHNSGDHSFELGHNKFSHLSFDEFAATYLAEPVPRKEGSRFVNAFEGVKADDSVDWTTTDFVTDVKDQGSCGSCWAFSTTGGMEGAYYLKNKSQQSFSEQQLVDCDTVADQGCNGGLMDNAFTYIAANGLAAESDYPYTSGGGQAGSCQSFTPVAGTTGITFTDVANSNTALQAAVTQQPISVAVDADRHWQLYKSGIMTKVSGTQLDHGVLAVGYGTDSGAGFWKIKNSWAEAWGEDGYIRIATSDQKDGPCGITSSASYPTLGGSSFGNLQELHGSYTGSDTELGLTVTGTVSLVDETHCNMKMSGAVNLECDGEAFTLAADGKTITLDNIGDSDNCVNKGLSDNHVTLKGITYDEAKDEITIKSKVLLVEADIVMTQSSSSSSSSSGVASIM